MSKPPLQSLPLVALTQRSGLPTMLLDWTRRAWVAAYFAAFDATEPTNGEKLKGATHLAVWAIERTPKSEGLFYDAPTAANPNVRAQSGLFSTYIPEDLTPPEQEGLESYVASLKDAQRPSLQRFTLPLSEAPKLLHHLAYEEITGATMFPGPAGVVRAMQERSRWDVPAETMSPIERLRTWRSGAYHPSVPEHEEELPKG